MLIEEKQGLVGVVAIMQRGLQIKVCGVVGIVFICKVFCLLAATFSVSKSKRGFLEQFAAKQACIQASLLVLRIALFLDLVFSL